MTDDKSVPKTLEQLVADKENQAKETTLGSLATTIFNANKKKADLKNTYAKQDAGQDAILAKANEINTNLGTLSSSDLVIALNELSGLVARGGAQG